MINNRRADWHRNDYRWYILRSFARSFSFSLSLSLSSRIWRSFEQTRANRKALVFVVVAGGNNNHSSVCMHAKNSLRWLSFGREFVHSSKRKKTRHKNTQLVCMISFWQYMELIQLETRLIIIDYMHINLNYLFSCFS
jgi:hypothetical protein